MINLFFSKKKKLAQIEAKVDKVMEMLEKQTKMEDVRENRIRQFLSEVLDEKSEALSDEGQRRMNVLETALKNTESIISVSAEQSIEEIKNLNVDLGKKAGAVKKELKAVRKEIEEEHRVENTLVEKLDLAENEIRMLLVNSVMDQLP